MNTRIQKLQDLSDLLKSNAITKEEFEILKKELFSNREADINPRTKLNDSYRKRVAELQLLRLNADRRNIVKPILETQNRNRTSAFAKNDNIVGKALFGIGLLFILGVVTYRMNNSQSTNYTSPTDTPSSNSSSYEQSQKSSTMANCVVCSKRVNYYNENTFSGHHFKVGGLMSSDVVCGLECDVILRRRNERILNKEMMDPNRYRDPDIKMPDFNK